jgi:cytochrome b
MSRNLVRVWDPAVRIGHWLLVVLFATAYLSGEAEASFHAYAGYGVAALVAFRLLWGFAGTRYARFAEFLRGPRETLAYLQSLAAGRPVHYTGHNPAGGWMIALLLCSLTLTAWTGLETYGVQGYGPLAQGVAVVAPARADEASPTRARKRRSPAERFWKRWHEGFANATLVLVFLHIAGALAASVLHRENLVRAMVTGDKRAHPPQ